MKRNEQGFNFNEVTCICNACLIALIFLLPSCRSEHGHRGFGNKVFVKLDVPFHFLRKCLTVKTPFQTKKL